MLHLAQIILKLNTGLFIFEKVQQPPSVAKVGLFLPTKTSLFQNHLKKISLLTICEK